MRESSLIVLALFLFFLAALMPSLSQQDVKTGILNASISQPICIELSQELAAGIFFTNTTTIGVQYPITNMTVWNNATENYAGASYGTRYYVKACAGVTRNLTVYQSVCDNLVNTTVGGTIYIAYDSTGEGKGIGVSNGTSATGVGDLPSFGPSGPDTFFLIGYKIDPNNWIYLRYWLNPEPNSVPSGIYSTTYKILAKEFGNPPSDTDAQC